MKRILYIVSALFCLVFLFVALRAYADDTRCGVGQIVCDGRCVANGTYPVAGTACDNPAFSIYNSCGRCVCGSSSALCESTNRCVSIPPPCTEPDEKFDACKGGCAADIAKKPATAQRGYFSVVGSTDSGGAPEGSVYYQSEAHQLRVKTATGWQPVGSNYTAGSNIDNTSLSSNAIAVVPNLKLTDTQTLTGSLEFMSNNVGDKLSLLGMDNTSRLGQTNMYGLGMRGGAIYQKSFNKHQWYINTNVDDTLPYVMQLDKDDNPAGDEQYRDLDTHLTLRGAAGRLADIILGDGTDDRWALSSRDTTPNFEILRNNGGWLQPSLRIDYSTGRVSFPLSLESIYVVGNTSMSGKADIGQTLEVGSTTLQADSSLISATGRYDSLDTGRYLFELATTNNNNIITPRFTISKDGNVVNSGNITVGASATINGSLTVNSEAVGDNKISVYNYTTGGDVANDTGGIIEIHGNEADEILRMDGNEISTDADTLYLQYNNDSDVRMGGDLSIDGDLDVEGLIRAGYSDVQITNAGGALKMAELANDDFDATGEGSMIFGADQTERCNNVCSSHGLVCNAAWQIIGSVASNSCTSTESKTHWRYCWCEGA